MSIPPLVCSTPPPPDQCEDYKDPEDFDLQYHLSQDDDEENYDYGNFSTYSNFQTTSENIKADISVAPKIVGNEDNEFTQHNKDIEIVVETDTTEESKFEEDINIEDLNLKLDEEAIERPDIIESKPACIETDLDTHNIDYPVKETHIPDLTTLGIEDALNTCALSVDDFAIASTSLDQVEESPTYVDDIEDDDLKYDSSDSNIAPDNNIIICADPATETVSVIKEITEIPLNISQNDDDFGEFDDFQSLTTENKPVAIVKDCDNPWYSEEPVDNDVGGFNANFDQIETNLFHSQDVKDRHPGNQTDTNNSEDDDFGDFNDFKSSAIESCGNDIEESCKQVPVLNLKSTDNEFQVTESINKVLSSIFDQELSEPVEEIEGNLESLLCETWGHLLETDVRQPYMVNWNNSSGQKTLLKALCIDSRNILFGPNWSCNMPKYAANLNAAPLQPQKQSTPPNASQGEGVNTDKTIPKTAGTWSDPFSSDGQEFTYAEALLLDLEHLMATLDQMAHNHSSLKISELLSHACNPSTGNESDAIDTGPTDLDVFEATVSTKQDKIFSSTINVQPLRQINLPDTHIFTPTDSETPRSKTIHYDNSPAVLLPQTVVENNKNPTDNSNYQPNNESVVNNLESDSEYWEFQDFKGKSDTLTPNTEAPKALEKVINATTNVDVAFGTQVLQPVKVEPIMPTLNWPDPGQVKEIFNDFSDFVSTTSWSNKKQDLMNTPTAIQMESKTFPELDDSRSSTSKNDNESNQENINTGKFDDDFDTFQSALPSSTSSIEFNVNNLNNSISGKPETMSTQKAPHTANFDCVFPIMDNVKPNTLKFANPTRPNQDLVQNPLPFSSNNLDNIKKPTTLSDKSSPIKPSGVQINRNNLLQPTPANSNLATQNQKSAQILQPLSLESYSQINWPNPGIDLQDLSRFNPVESLQSLKSDSSTNNHSKGASPVHSQKSSVNNQVQDDDIWGDFVSSKPKQTPPKKPPVVDDDEWTDFVSSPSVKPQNGLNTISLNVHTNLNIQKSSNPSKFSKKHNQIQLDIPSLNYITPKSSNHKSYNDRHFENL